MLGILSWRPGNPATDKSIYVVRDGDLRRPRTAPVITLVQRPSRATTSREEIQQSGRAWAQPDR